MDSKERNERLNSFVAINRMKIKFRLPEDERCTRKDVQGYCHCASRTGGDVLEGEVEIGPPLDGNFSVEVRFEGTLIWQLFS
jgi:hypothetical protein